MLTEDTYAEIAGMRRALDRIATILAQAFPPEKAPPPRDRTMKPTKYIARCPECDSLVQHFKIYDTATHKFTGKCYVRCSQCLWSREYTIE